MLTLNCLLVGSGWYVKDWWEKYNSLLKFNYVFAINNAFLVTREQTTHWYIPNDFIYNKKYDLTEFKIDKIGLDICSYFIEKPYWYWDPNNGTMILNCLYDILNRSILNEYKVNLYTIGCDLVYNKEVNHFYGNGTPDPLRLGDESLKNHLEKINYLYKENGSFIKNLSNYETLLPFERIDVNNILQ